MNQQHTVESADRADRPAMPVAVAAAVASLAYAVPFAISRSTSPTPDHPRVFLWYRSLRQPAFKPPDIAIPIAWSLIETGLAVAAFRLLRKRPSANRTASLALLAGNVAAIGGWSRLFFGSRNLPASAVAAAAMIGTGAAYVSAARPADKVAAAAGVPFVAWVAFATLLTAAIARRNR
ncbi:MAG: TspO/MBR family protein [Burkholderiaceae bacterium]